MDLLTQDTFHVWEPAALECEELQKGGETIRRIGGYCSTEHLDRQKEVVLQKGLSFEEFLSFGYFNDNHNQATAAVVGIPDRAEFHPGKGWYTSGQLLKGYKRADEIWDLAQALKSTPRRLGFSIEGKILERQDNRIVKAIIRNVAITNAPVNTHCTWEVLGKSFHPDVAKGLAISSGAKAPNGGSALVPEDLERRIRKCNDKKTRRKKKRERMERSLSIDDAAVLIHRLRPQYGLEACLRIARVAQAKEG